MEVFFSFPPEVQTQVLCFLSQHELTNLFNLTDTLKNKPFLNPETDKISAKNKAFFSLQLQALFAMFHRKPLLLSNDFASKSMPLCHLKRLLDMGVHITPSSVNINVYDFTDYAGSFSLWDCFSPSLFAFLQRLNSSINIELVVWENKPMDKTMLKIWLEPLIKRSIRVTSFKLKYSYSNGFVSANHGAIAEAHESRKEIVSTPTEKLSTERLDFHFFGGSEISRQLSLDHSCFDLRNIQHIDLSFNQLTEFDLRSFTFPEGLKSLNLSNNSISIFDDESIFFKNLPELRELDLSNNNIMRLDICHSQNPIPTSIERLNLSGNFLSIYSSLFEGHLFGNLQELNLSHNLLGHLTKFPCNLLEVNLSGNYINAQSDLSSSSFPAHLKIVGIDHCLFREKVLDLEQQVLNECKT